MRQRVRSLLCPLALLLSSCSSTGTQNNDLGCLVFSPIYVHTGDIFTDSTAREILNHDLIGEQICHWQRNINNATADASRA